MAKNTVDVKFLNLDAISYNKGLPFLFFNFYSESSIFD